MPSGSSEYLRCLHPVRFSCKWTARTVQPSLCTTLFCLRILSAVCYLYKGLPYLILTPSDLELYISRLDKMSICHGNYEDKFQGLMEYTAGIPPCIHAERSSVLARASLKITEPMSAFLRKWICTTV